MLRAAAPACTLSLAAFAAACGPVSVEQAEASCFRSAQLAQHPRGHVAIGVGSRGEMIGDAEINVTSDYLLGRDPSQVYASCVMRQSGQMPRTQLFDRPDWKG